MQQNNSTYLVAKYLKSHKKSYIHDMKRVCEANNIGQRVMILRNTHGWTIDTIFERYEGSRAIYYYKVLIKGKMPDEFVGKKYEIEITNLILPK